MMTQTLQLTVAGMSCAGCEQRLGTALRRLEGVREAELDHRSGRVRVVTDPTVSDPQAVIDRIEAAGYQVSQTAGEQGR